MHNTYLLKKNEFETISLEWGKVIPFPVKAEIQTSQAITLFSMSDKMAALNWAEKARLLGVTHISFEASDNYGDDDTGEFIMVYERASRWASWGIGCSTLGMTLWRSACGTTIGQFETLPKALEILSGLVAQPKSFAAWVLGQAMVSEVAV